MIPRDIRYTVTSLPMQAGNVPAGAPAPAPSPVAALENVPSTMTAGTPGAAQVRNIGTVPATWALTAGSGLTITPSSGTLAPGATQALALNTNIAGTYTLVMTVAGGNPAGSPATIAVSDTVTPPSITLSALGGLTTVTGAPLNFGVLLANPAALPLVGTPRNVAGTAVFSPTSVNWALGDLNKAFAATWAAAGAKSIDVLGADGTVSNTLAVTVNPAPPPPPPAPTLATLSGSASATAGVAHPDTVTLDVAADQNYTVTWSRSNSATGQTTSTIATGQTTAVGSSTWPAAGSGRTVDFTISPSITRAGRPLTVTVAASPTPPPPPSPPPPAPGGGARAFSLLSSTTGTGVPFSVGFAFRKGDIASGSGVVSDHGTLQVTPKSAWADGSLKFAVLSGTADITSGTPRVITLSAGTSSTGTALATTDLPSGVRTTGISVDCGAFGTVNWSGTDFDSPFATWVSGHRMSSWIYRKPVGSDAHLVAWLEVRLFAGGAVEVLPWIENGYLNVASPTNKSATYSFTLGGTSRFSAAIDLKHHTRTPLVSGSALSHWLGVDPGLVALHHAGYLQQTELVPTYGASVAASAAVVTALPSTYTPLQAGSLVYSGDDMSSTGYQAPIGLLPEHDVLYLTVEESARAAVWAAVQRNGYSAGRYGIHYRDETTNRPPLFSAYPTLVIGSSGSTTSTYTPTPSGGNAPVWDVAHSPSVGYMAYLLTGRFYHLETAQFAAVTDHFLFSDVYRAGGYYSDPTPAPGYTGASGIIQSIASQLRAAAWQMRTVAQALCITPTTDPVRAGLLTSVESTINFHHARYVAQSNNPFGFVEPDVDYGTVGVYLSSPWMQDFFTAAFGYTKAMQLSSDSTVQSNLTAFFAWTAQSVVGRFGTSSSPDWWYINAAPYKIAVAPSDTPNWKTGAGPWYSTWRDMYDATAPTEPSRGSAEGTLAGNTEAFPEPTSPAQWHNIQPALAYAVRHGVSGAQAAYDRMVSAANWQGIQAVWATKPVWAVRPPLPAWLRGVAVNQAVQITGTAIRYGQGPGTRLSYSGIACRDTLLVLAATGGHNDCSDNGVDSLNLAADTPAWTARIAPYSSPVTSVNYYRTTPTVEPSSHHSYNHHIWNAQRQRLISHNTRSPWGSGGALVPTASNGLNVDAWTWDASGTIPESGYCVVQDAAGRCYGRRTDFAVTEYDPVANTKTDLAGFAGQVPIGAMAYDSSRDVFFSCAWGDGQGTGSALLKWRYSARFASQTAITFNASAAATALNADSSYDCTMFYAAALDAFFYWTGSTLYKITPNAGTTWDVSIVTISGASLPAPSHAHTRACYVPSLRGMAYLPSDSSNVYFVRLA